MPLRPFLPPADPLVWVELLDDGGGEMVGYGDIGEFYRGVRQRRFGAAANWQHGGGGVGKFFSSLWWDYIQPKLETIGRRTVQGAASAIAQSIRSGRGGAKVKRRVKRRQPRDIFDHGNAKTRRKQTPRTSTPPHGDE